jgi:hypothetical protein
VVSCGAILVRLPRVDNSMSGLLISSAAGPRRELDLRCDWLKKMHVVKRDKFRLITVPPCVWGQ